MEQSMKCEREGCEYVIQDHDKVYEVHTQNWSETFFTCSRYCAELLKGPNNALTIGAPRYRGIHGPDRFPLLASTGTPTRQDSKRRVGTSTTHPREPLGERGDLGLTFRPRGITGKERHPWLEGDNG